MNANLQALTAMCEELSIDYKTYHSANNIVEIHINNTPYHFVNWTTPLNRQSIVYLCKDKDYFYTVLHDSVPMAKTLSFLNPYCDDKYTSYLKENSFFDIILSIEKELPYPVIVKKNSGSWGSNVFKADTRKDLEKALLTVFNVNSSSYDYIALAQQYIDIDIEYRAVFFEGKIQFAYSKSIENATYDGNLSPLHWEGAVAEAVEDKKILTDLELFATPIFKKINLLYCGLDIAIDKNGAMSVIEGNSSPGFDHIIKAGRVDLVKKMYRNIIEYLKSNGKKDAL